MECISKREQLSKEEVSPTGEKITGKDFSDVHVGYVRESIINDKCWIFNTDELKVRKDRHVGKFI